VGLLVDDGRGELEGRPPLHEGVDGVLQVAEGAEVIDLPNDHVIAHFLETLGLCLRLFRIVVTLVGELADEGIAPVVGCE